MKSRIVLSALLVAGPIRRRPHHRGTAAGADDGVLERARGPPRHGTRDGSLVAAVFLEQPRSRRLRLQNTTQRQRCFSVATCIGGTGFALR